MRNRTRNHRRSVATPSLFEPLESRILLSAASITALLQRYFVAIENQILINQRKNAGKNTGITHTFVLPSKVKPGDATAPASALTPAEVRGAYGINLLNYDGLPLDGAGQTIAIIDAYDDPNAAADLTTFSNAFDLPTLQAYNANGNTGAFFRKVSQTGTTVYPPTDPAGAGNPNGTWELEESLDIEWAHAMAPAANIILVEATSPTDANLIEAAVNWARNAPGVSVVSMSFSGGEFSGESSLDTYFTTPAGHQGVTFLASTGDQGEPSGYPAYSPNVIAVGGTSLTVSGDSYGSETGWNDSGGGISTEEAQPYYQNGVVTQSSTQLTAPDVSADANPNVGGVAIYDSWDYGAGNGWLQIGGTSLSAPLWSGIIALTDQLRSLHGLSSLDGGTQTLPQLYKLPATDFHDITSGNNGFAAGPGYDLVTGRGTPIANLLVPDLAGIAAVSGTVFQDNNSNGAIDGADSPLAGVTVFADDNDNGVLDPGAQITTASANVPLAIPDNNATGVISTLTVSGVLTAISHISITFNITHTDDSNLTAYLIAPDGTQIILFQQVGGTGKNFTNTTLDDQATTLLSNASAPFSGTYQPSGGALADFIGKNADGTWKLQLVDSVKNHTGTLNSWSLTITTSAEQSAVTNSAGQYSFAALALGSTHYLRQILPTNYIQDSPANGSANAVALAGNTANINFGDFPTVFSAAGPTDSFYVTLDASHTYLEIYDADSALGSPTYQIQLSLMPRLALNLLGSANNITIDYTNGSPLPPVGISVLADVNSNDTLTVIGQSPSQAFTMTDTQIGPASAPAISYQNISTLALSNMTATYSGNFATLNNLIINNTATFIWD